MVRVVVYHRHATRFSQPLEPPSHAAELRQCARAGEHIGAERV